MALGLQHLQEGLPLGPLVRHRISRRLRWSITFVEARRRGAGAVELEPGTGGADGRAGAWDGAEARPTPENLAGAAEEERSPGEKGRIEGRGGERLHVQGPEDEGGGRTGGAQPQQYGDGHDGTEGRGWPFAPSAAEVAGVAVLWAAPREGGYSGGVLQRASVESRPVLGGSSPLPRGGEKKPTRIIISNRIEPLKLTTPLSLSHGYFCRVLRSMITIMIWVIDRSAHCWPSLTSH